MKDSECTCRWFNWHNICAAYVVCKSLLLVIPVELVKILFCIIISGVAEMVHGICEGESCYTGKS